MSLRGLMILGFAAISIVSLQIGCAKSDSKSKSSDSEKAEQTETIGDGLKVKKNADGTLDPQSMKQEFRKKYPELAQKCGLMGKTFIGAFKQWTFSVEHWTLGKSSEKLTSQQMHDKGYEFVYEFYPSDVEVTLDQSQLQLSTKMNTGSETKTVVWDILPNAAGQCVLFHDLNQGSRLMRNWIMIVAPLETNAEGSVKLSFQWWDSADKYRAFGQVHLQR